MALSIVRLCRVSSVHSKLKSPRLHAFLGTYPLWIPSVHIAVIFLHIYVRSAAMDINQRDFDLTPRKVPSDCIKFYQIFARKLKCDSTHFWAFNHYTPQLFPTSQSRHKDHHGHQFCGRFNIKVGPRAHQAWHFVEFEVGIVRKGIDIFGHIIISIIRFKLYCHNVFPVILNLCIYRKAWCQRAAGFISKFCVVYFVDDDVKYIYFCSKCLPYSSGSQ